MSSWNFNEKNKKLLDQIIQRTHESHQNLVVKNKLLHLFANIKFNNAEYSKETTLQIQEAGEEEVINLISDSDSDEKSVIKEEIAIKNHYFANTEYDFQFFIDTLENNENVDDTSILENIECTDKYFIELEKHLSVQGVYSFTMIVAALEIQNDSIVKLFCKHILLPKFINLELTSNCVKGIIEMSKKYSNIICECLLSNLLFVEHPNSKSLKFICEQLDVASKNYILRQLILNCPNEIEEKHLELIQTVYLADLEDYLKRRLITLLNGSVFRFTTSKIYGRLLVTILKSVGAHLIECQSMLSYIIEHNRSIYKRSASKLLIEVFGNEILVDHF